MNSVEKLALSPGMTVSELLAGQPQMVNLLLEMHLDCAGCGMSRFCTLEEVCREYGIRFDQLLIEIQKRSIDHESNPNPNG